MTNGASEYVSAVRELPQPSWAQTERFARYVSGAHSWYKHLSIHPKVPLVFFLDPGAGMNRVHTRTGELALVETTDESRQFHYTWQTIRDYRRRFGHWNYHTPYGNVSLFAGEGGLVSTEVARLGILSVAGDWVNIPAGLVQKGTAAVSALMHYSSALGMQFSLWGGDLRRFGIAEFSDAGDASAFGAEVAIRCLRRFLQGETASRQGGSDELPSEIFEAIREAGNRFPKAIWANDWPAEDWLEELRGTGVAAELISRAVKRVEVEWSRSLAKQIWLERERSSAWPVEEVVAVAGLIAEERAHQLQAMTDAMNDIVEAIFDCPNGG